MEGSQPSYLGNPNLYRQAVWLCFYNEKGFQDFRVTTIFGKSRDQNRKKAKNSSGVHFWISKMVPMVNDQHGAKLYVSIFGNSRYCEIYDVIYRSPTEISVGF